MKKTVLVTGGAGYIGSHTCKALAEAGFEPVVYDGLLRGNAWAVRWGPMEQGDLMDEDRLREVLRTYRPEGVIHFAAFAYVGESMQDPLSYYRNNTCGTVALLRAMAAEGVGSIVFSSTCATYGRRAFGRRAALFQRRRRRCGRRDRRGARSRDAPDPAGARRGTGLVTAPDRVRRRSSHA